MSVLNSLRDVRDWFYCQFGNHEDILALVPPGPKTDDGKPGTPPVLRLQCINCRRVTTGWTQDPAAYRVTQAGRPAQISMVNPRLAPAAAIVAPAAAPVAAVVRRVRRPKAPKVLKAPNVVKFGLVKQRRVG